jgi:hypothetical protein
MARYSLRISTILLTAVAFGAALAHPLSMWNKLPLSREAYFAAQQIYRGWSLLGIPIVAALISTCVLAWMESGDRVRFWLLATAAGAIAAALAIFFVFTFPANEQTENWTMAPANWEELRLRWEYSHAAAACLYFAALALICSAFLVDRQGKT